jgi:hypothetical protein
MEAAYIGANYEKAKVLAEMSRAYSGMLATDQDDLATVWFSFLASNPTVTPNALTLSAEIVTLATAAVDAEVTWEFAGDSSTNVPITKAVLTTNVATLTFGGAHKLAVGQKIAVSGVGAPYDGPFTIVSVPSASTLTYAVVSGVLTAAPATGFAKLQGLSVTRDFVTPCQPFVTLTVDTAALPAVKYGAYVKVPYTAPS